MKSMEEFFTNYLGEQSTCLRCGAQVLPDNREKHYDWHGLLTAVLVTMGLSESEDGL